MDNTVPSLQLEIKTLIENNEILLKSKSRLQQELLLLKRQLITQDKNLDLISEQESSLSTQDRLLTEKEKGITAVLQQRDELQLQLQDLRKQMEELTVENARLRKLKWYHLLTGKR